MQDNSRSLYKELLTGDVLLTFTAFPGYRMNFKSSLPKKGRNRKPPVFRMAGGGRGGDKRKILI